MNLVFLAAAVEAGSQTSPPIEKKPIAPQTLASPSEEIIPGKSDVEAKLKSIILPEVSYDNIPIAEVVTALVKESRERDSDGVGINCLLNPSRALDPAPPRIDPSTGLPLAAHYTETADLDSIVIRIRPPLKNVRLYDLLEIIQNISTPPVAYSIEDYGVMLSLKSTVPDARQRIFTRWFKIRSDIMIQALDSMHSLDPKNASPSPIPPEGNERSQRLITELRELLLESGLDMSAPSALYLHNDRLDMLMVRGTIEELDHIEQVVQVINAPPPQVTIEVKWFKVDPESDWHSGLGITLGSPKGTSNLTWRTILTPAQYHLALRTLEQSNRAKMVTAQKVTTMSGRHVQIKADDIKYVVTSLNVKTNQADANHPEEITTVTDPISRPFELGPVIDLVPVVEPDDHTVSLNIISTLRDFVGYHNTTNFLTIVRKQAVDGTVKETESPTPLPIFRLRRSVARVADGQTLVLEVGSDRYETAGGEDSEGGNKTGGTGAADPTKAAKKEFVIFVTPQMIDPAGNPIHSDAEVAE